MRPQDVEGWVPVLEATRQAGIHKDIWSMVQGLKKKKPRPAAQGYDKPIISLGGG